MIEPPHHPNQVKRLADICFAVFDGDVFTKCRERRFVDSRITFSKLLQEQGYGCSQIGIILKAREEYIGEDPVFYYSAPELRAKFLEMRDECNELLTKYQTLRERVSHERRLEPLIDMVGTEEEVYNKLNRIYNGL